MKTRIILSFVCFFIGLSTYAQDRDYAHRVIDTLASDTYYGRGYINHGDLKAAQFISKEFEKMGVKKFGEDYFQDYKIRINTIPEIDHVKLDDKSLVGGEEYLISPTAKELKGTFPIFHLRDSLFDDKEALAKIAQMDLSKHFIMTEGRFRTLFYKQQFECKGIIYYSPKKMVWSVSRTEKPSKYRIIKIRLESYPTEAKEISLDYETKLIKKYKTQNVVGYVEGKKRPDSFFVFTAHYDHLGMMGDVIFNGANDNASGVAMVLDLARHYSKPENQPDYSIAFILVSGEESGLHGSFHYADNPLFPLEQISFLINLDMVGTGSKGMTFVNGQVYSNRLKHAIVINEEMGYMPKIKLRGESCNSDHCPFYKKGVPSVFIYTMGDEHREYHNIYDQSKTLPLTRWNELFMLLTDFVKATSV
jgi:hypothetical protein